MSQSAADFERGFQARVAKLDNAMCLAELRDALDAMADAGVSPRERVIICCLDNEHYVHSVEAQQGSPVIMSDEEDSTGVETT